jgi:hypothetical protein
MAKVKRISADKPGLVKTGARQSDFSFNPNGRGVKCWNAPEGYGPASPYFDRLYYVGGHWIHHQGSESGPKKFADDIGQSGALELFIRWRMDISQELMEYANQESTSPPGPAAPIHSLSVNEARKRIRTALFNQESSVELPQYVTLDQMAARVNRSKKTLERKKKNDPTMPPPVVEGGGGKPDEWEWDKIRFWLEKEFGRKLPERLPEPANGH